MKRALIIAVTLLSSACFNFDESYDAYCARTGLCDGGTSNGGGTGKGGGSATGGGSHLGGGSAQGGGSTAGGSAQGGGSSTGGGATAGGSAQGGGTAATCGGMQCTTPINGAAFCDAGSCDIACNTTFHRCGFSCVDNFNPAACGPSCLSCPNPGGIALRSCDAGVCDFACPTNYQRCNGTCTFAGTNACGPSCAVCLAPGGGQPFCDAGSCDFNCTPPAVRMGGACISPPVLTFPNISDVTDPNTFIDARLEPGSSGSLWALDFSGQLLHSADLGQTAFTVVCKLPGTGLNSTWSGFNQRNTARIFLSHASDHTAYVESAPNGSSYYGHLYRADMSSGTCTDITPFGNGSSSYFWSTPWGTSAAVTGDGTLYDFDSDFQSTRIRKSTDHGTTWTPTLVDAGNFTTYMAGSLTGGPGPDLAMSVFTGNTGNPTGLYLITDAGTAFTKVSATLYGTGDQQVHFSWLYPNEAYVNRATSTNDGFISVNGGQSWVDTPAYAMVGDWALDPVTNQGFRLAVYDGGVNVERGGDFHAPPSWTRLNAFFPFASPNTVATARLDAVNGQLAVVIDMRLYVSGDSGATFRRIGTKPPVVFGGTLDSVDGLNVYLTSSQVIPPTFVATYSSADKGLNFTQRGTVFANASVPMQVRVNPALATNVLSHANNPNTATYSTALVVSHDGFVTADAGSIGASNWNNAFSFTPTVAGTSYFFSLSSTMSTNFGDTYLPLALTPSLPNVWYYPWAQVTHDPTFAVVSECYGQNSTYRVNLSLKTVTDITTTLSSFLGNEKPCSGELYLSGATWRLRMVSKTGWLAVSDDDAATFSSVVGAGGGLTSCNDRRITSLPTDRSVVVSWCATNNRIWVSRNGGQTWTEPTSGVNWTAYQCQLNSVALIDSARLAVGCTSRPAVLMDY